VNAAEILRVMCAENNRVSLKDGVLSVKMKAPFEAAAVRLML
jgi:hypothetical protein